MQKFETNLLCNEFKKVNLVTFLEKELGLIINQNKDKFTCLCPMPFHKDSQPSFNIYKMQTDMTGDCWVYHCFGCGSGGTIIDFCMAYWSLETSTEAVAFLAEKMGIKDTYEVLVKSLKDAKIEINMKKKTDSEHFIVSKRCYSLLKKYNNNEQLKSLVFGYYKKMNELLKTNDFKAIENIGRELTKKQKEIVYEQP